MSHQVRDTCFLSKHTFVVYWRKVSNCLVTLLFRYHLDIPRRRSIDFNLNLKSCTNLIPEIFFYFTVYVFTHTYIYTKYVYIYTHKIQIQILIQKQLWSQKHVKTNLLLWDRLKLRSPNHRG